MSKAAEEPWEYHHPYIYGRDDIYPVAEVLAIQQPLYFDNGRRIAAAPDMEAALELAIRWAEERTNLYFQDHGWPQVAKAALAKARGEAYGQY